MREFHVYTLDRQNINVGLFVWTNFMYFNPGDWFLTFRVCNNTKVRILMQVSEVRLHHAGLGVKDHGTYCGGQLKHVSHYDPIASPEAIEQWARCLVVGSKTSGIFRGTWSRRRE